MNITIGEMAKVLAEEIVKNLDDVGDRAVVGALYYEWLIRKLEGEKVELQDSLMDMRVEFEESQNKAVANALLVEQRIALVTNNNAKLLKEINEFDKSNTELLGERDSYKASYARVCKKYVLAAQKIRELEFTLLQYQLDKLHSAEDANDV